jgi:hypothetical protein
VLENFILTEPLSSEHLSYKASNVKFILQCLKASKFGLSKNFCQNVCWDGMYPGKYAFDGCWKINKGNYTIGILLNLY